MRRRCHINDVGGTLCKRLGEVPGLYEAVEQNMWNYLASTDLFGCEVEHRAREIAETIQKLKAFNRGAGPKPTAALGKYGRDIANIGVWAIDQGLFNVNEELLYTDAVMYLKRARELEVEIVILSDSSKKFVDVYLSQQVNGKPASDLISRMFLNPQEYDKRKPATFSKICHELALEGGLVELVFDDDKTICDVAVRAKHEFGLQYDIYLMDRPNACVGISKANDCGIKVVNSYAGVLT
ncbi:MAG: hypothetical protein Q8O89_08175 [Nanoarchaeota archaeon]|nr:hypothetical protein [Nanoarchaeota archaeon]